MNWPRWGWNFGPALPCLGTQEVFSQDHSSEEEGPASTPGGLPWISTNKGVGSGWWSLSICQREGGCQGYPTEDLIEDYHPHHLTRSILNEEYTV